MNAAAGRLKVPIEWRDYGGNRSSVVLMPGICGLRLVYLSIRNATGGWAIRDFISNRILEDERSDRPADEIEAEVTYSEYPPFYSVTDRIHWAPWEVYLNLRTIAHFRRNDQDLDRKTVPSAEFGEWSRIDSEWRGFHA